jgi:4-amino-4-deoxy-L-arabinose transferase-like glycosyltransferase
MTHTTPALHMVRAYLGRDRVHRTDRAPGADHGPESRTPVARAHRTGLGTWCRGHWYGLLLALLTLGTMGGYLCNLKANGWANSFYAAAVQAGSQNWEAFLFGSSDAANAITVDKPPAALWPMELSVRVFGLGSVQMLAPQVVLAGLVVLMLGRSVRIDLDGLVGATASRWAGLSAGAVFALTPVAALMFRFNNPDAMLIALMAAAVLCTQQAVRSLSGRTAQDTCAGRVGRRLGRRASTGGPHPAAWLALAGVALGFGFLTKQFQVLFIVPGLVAAWLLGVSLLPRVIRPGWTRRLGLLAWPILTMVVSAGWWVALTELLPDDMHPYVGGSQNNSFLELTFGYNGLGRLTGDETGSVGPGGNFGETGWSRLLSGSFALQGSWLLPIALLSVCALAASLVSLGRAVRKQALAEVPVGTTTRAAFDAQALTVPAKTSAAGRRGGPVTPTALAAGWTALVAWGGWLLVTWLVLSNMNGIVHEYYTVALSPAIAACIALAVPVLLAHRRIWTHPVLAVGAAGTGAYAFWLSSSVSGVPAWLRWTVLGAGLLAGVVLIVRGLPGISRGLGRSLAAVALVAGLVAGLSVPSVLTVNTVNASATGSLVQVAGTGGMGGGQGGPGLGGQQTGSQSAASPSADGTAQGSPSGGMGGLLTGSEPSTELSEFLAQDAGDYTWMAAIIGSNNASGYQLSTGQPVMAIGGYNGTDPAPTLAGFQEYVAQGRIHYYIAASNLADQDDSAARIAEWVEQNYTAQTVDGTTVYDLGGN